MSDRSDATAEELAAELAQHQSLVGARDPQQPDVWFRWCICGWDGGPLAPGESSNDGRSYRGHLADALLSGPLAPLLAKLGAVEELAARTRAYPPSAVPLGMLLRALDAKAGS